MDTLIDFLAEARSAHQRNDWGASYAAFVRASERAFFMPKKFAFQQRCRQGRTMYGHHGLLGAGAHLVNHFGNQLLAGPAFAQEHNCRSSRSHLAH